MDMTWKTFFLTILASTLVLTDVAASAQTAPNAAAACANPNSGLPASLSGWAKSPVPITTAHDVTEAAGRPFPFGQRAALKLDKTDSVKFAHQPGEQMPKQYIYSGMVSIRVPKDGDYTVMIREANWVDVVQNRQLVTARQMGGRIACAKYGKKLEFPLKSGDAFVQFFGAPYETVDVLVAPTS
jgi:hypothetical protein